MTGLGCTEVTLICATALVGGVTVAAAAYLGYRHGYLRGYWTRVMEEKDARGIV